MRASGPMTPLASFTGVCSATNLSTAWTGLAPGTCYEWCVAVNDGISVQNSAVWQFTTTAAQAPSPAPAGPGSISMDRATQTISLSWPTTVGSVYQLVYRDNIASGPWLPTGQQLTADSSTLSWMVPIDPAVPARFFALLSVR